MKKLITTLLALMLIFTATMFLPACDTTRTITVGYTDYAPMNYENEAGEWQRAWSTYIEVGYAFNLPLGVVLDTRVGITPWRGSYSDYEEVWKNAKTVAINNIHLRAQRDFELKGVSLGAWAECMLNCYGLDKTNLTTNLENKFEQRFNWSVGACVYFSSEW